MTKNVRSEADVLQLHRIMVRIEQKLDELVSKRVTRTGPNPSEVAVEAVCAEWGIDREGMLVGTSESFCWARFTCCALLSEYSTMSQAERTRFFGRQHPWASHAESRVRERVKTDKRFAQIWDSLLETMSKTLNQQPKAEPKP